MKSPFLTTASWSPHPDEEGQILCGLDSQGSKRKGFKGKCRDSPQVLFIPNMPNVSVGREGPKLKAASGDQRGPV